MSLGKSFRYGPYPQYKSNRTQEKPRGTDEAKAYLRAHYRILEYEGLEADDCMGISATEPQDETVRIIISTDKDMLQIPGWQFNPDKDRFPHKPTVEQADAFLDFQVCCGDPGDGYPGVPGVGIAKYRKWVQAYGGCLFEKNGLSPEYKESMVACAKILRWEDKPHDWPTTY
jgi:5'-3' exonuclease